MARDTIAAMAQRALVAAPARFGLAGLSMGGYVALEIMRQAPERVTHLALFDTSARPDDEARKKISAVQDRLTAEYGYDEHSAKEALSYVTTLLAQE